MTWTVRSSGTAQRNSQIDARLQQVHSSTTASATNESTPSPDNSGRRRCSLPKKGSSCRPLGREHGTGCHAASCGAPTTAASRETANEKRLQFRRSLPRTTDRKQGPPQAGIQLRVARGLGEYSARVQRVSSASSRIRAKKKFVTKQRRLITTDCPGQR